MRVAYLDGFAGVAGDMMLGALLDAGVPLEVLQQATAALGLGAWLQVQRVDRSGISSTQVTVMEDEQAVEGSAVASVVEPAVSPGMHSHGAGLVHSHEPRDSHEQINSHEPVESLDADFITEPTAHSQDAAQGRSLTEIRAILQAAPLHAEVRQLALQAFELLGAAEAKVHNVAVDEIHFHEVGAVDAMVDIVAASAGIHHLQIGRWVSAPLNVGGGMVRCAHGLFPVPAPATAELLRGVPTYSAHLRKELVTPTGAALVRALQPEFGAQPAMTVELVGYGAGSRNPAGFANVLRLVVGEAEVATAQQQEIVVLEAALDDLSPQVLAYVAERALAEGALDVMQSAVTMKKGRAGTLLTVLCEPRAQGQLEALLLRETSTLGVRSRREQRTRLERSFVRVETEFGAVRVKVGRRAGEELNAAPEFEDCRAAAEQHGVPLKRVQQAALTAYQLASQRRPQ